MSVLSNEIKARLVETKVKEASLTIKVLLDMICKHWEKCLDNYYIMESEPELSTDDCSDSVTVSLSCYDRVNINHIVDDVAMLLEEELEEFIKKQEILATAEEGENGTL